MNRDDLDRACQRAFNEWEFVWRLREDNPEMANNEVWQGLQAHLANRADCAFYELEAYEEQSESDQ